MTRKNILMASVWAIGTFAVVLAAVLPSTLNAADPALAKSTVAQPTLSVNDVNLTIDVLPSSSQFPMMLKVTAVNPGAATSIRRPSWFRSIPASFQVL